MIMNQMVSYCVQIVNTAESHTDTRQGADQRDMNTAHLFVFLGRGLDALM